MPTPEARADRLVAALGENTHALNSVKRRYRWTLVLSTLLAVTFSYAAYSNHEANIETCESSNEIRTDIDTKLGSISDFLGAVIEDTPPNRDFLELLESDLPRRDCSDIDWFG